MLFQLPNGLLDGMDLFNYVKIDEIKGKQQNYLANTELVIGNIGHVPKLLADLVLSFQTKEGVVWKGKIEEAVDKIPSGDVETILIKIRENTYGPRFFFEAECTHCGEPNKNQELKLDTLELDILPLQEMIETTHRLVKLPKSGQEVELKPLYLKDLFEVMKITQTKHDELVTSLAATSIKRIGDKTNITSSDIDNMPVKDILYIQKKVEEAKLEGYIDTDIIVTCKKCKEEFTVKLNVFDPDFFDPSKDTPS